MKIRNLFVMLLLGGSLIFSGSVFTGCASWSNTGKGAAIGAGSGTHRRHQGLWQVLVR